MLQTLLDTYYCVGWTILDPRGERTEWRIHRYMYDEAIYILYRKAANPEDTCWMWDEWLDASKEERQQWFKQQKPITMKNMTATDIMTKFDNYNNFQEKLARDLLAHNEPVLTWNKYETIPCTPYHANEEKPMRALCSSTTPAPLQLTGIAVTGSIEASKTDTQTQREYLLERHREIDASTRWGGINGKMTEAFAIHIDNRPKTAKELFDGITSGKFTLKADEAARQEIFAAKHGREDFDDIFDAVDWGGLKPDRAGYEAARDKAIDDLKAAKDTIMIGSPSDGLAALQALEAWTPPATPAN